MGPGHFFNRVDSALETIEETIFQTEWTLVQRRSIHVAVKADSRVLFISTFFSQEKAFRYGVLFIFCTFFLLRRDGMTYMLVGYKL